MPIFADHRTLPVASLPTPSQSKAAKVYRFLAGAPLDGYVRTDATFLRPATAVLTPTGHATRWHKMPGWKRAAWRILTPAGTAAGGVGYLTHPDLTLGVLAAGAAGTAAYGGRKVHRWVSERRHRRSVVQPLLSSLRGPLGLPLNATAARWLIVPKNPARPGQITRIYLPDEWLGEDVQKMAVTRLVTRWLDAPVEAVRWHLTSAPRFVEFSPVRQPPKAVAWKATGDPYRLHIGKDAAGEDVYCETLTDTPSTAFVGGSGSGKTTALTLPLLGARTSGQLVDVLDLKRMSYTERTTDHPDGIAGDPTRPSGTVTGVRIHTTIESAIRAIAEFLASATAVALMQQAGEDTSHIPGRLLLVDEFGSLAGGAKAWWKGPGKRLTGKSPYVVPYWFHVALMQGRALDHRLALGAHQLSLHLFGDAGSDARDLFSGRLLIGEASAERWVTTFGRIRKPAYDAKIKGRGAFGPLGSAPSVVQVAYVPQQEANAMLRALPDAPAWFDSGACAPWITEDHIREVEESYSAGRWVPGWEWLWEGEDPADESGDSVYVTESERHDRVTADPAHGDQVPVQRESPVGTRHVTPVVTETVTDSEPHLTLLRFPAGTADTVPTRPDGRRYTLAAAAREGIIPMTADALRQAKRRSPDFPAGEEGTWSAEELVRWFEGSGRAVND